MIELLENKSFQLWEYQVSHGSLLIRSPRSIDQKFNIDIKFFAVEFLSIPRHLDKIVVSKATNDEMQWLERQMSKPVEKDKIFLLESRSGRHLIVAAKMSVEKNELDIFDSSFD